MSRLARTRPMPEIVERLLHPCVLAGAGSVSRRAPSGPARRIVQSRSPAGVLAESGDGRGDVGDMAEVTAADAHGQVDGRLHVDMGDPRRHVDGAYRGHVAERIDRHRALIGTSRMVSIERIFSSGYWTPTKYWLWLTGSIQKFFLLNWMLELRVADNQVLHDVQTAWRPRIDGLHLVDIDDVLGIVEPLQDPAIDDTVDLGDLGHHPLGDQQWPCRVLARI